MNANNLKLLGGISGLLLFALLALAVYQQLRDAIRSRDPLFILGDLDGDTCVDRQDRFSVPVSGLWLRRVSLPVVGDSVADVGPARYYWPGHLLAYTPGYLYVRGIPGVLCRALGEGGQILVRVPPVFADAVLTLLVLAFVRRSQSAYALVAIPMVALNPALVFDTVVWGQNYSSSRSQCG